MRDLVLHPTKGLNPKLTFCPRCHSDGPELILVGVHDKVYKCEDCKTAHIGRPPQGRCQNCKSYAVHFERNLGELERLPGDLCETCKKELAVFKAEVVKGGVYWRCKDCAQNGVIKTSAPLAAQVRAQMHIEVPQECGVEFDARDCPACTGMMNQAQ